MTLPDLTGFGKAAEKLIEAISGAASTLYRPRSIRNEAKAEGDRIRTIAKATVDAKNIETQGALEIWERAQERMRIVESRRQLNLENITRLAIEHAGRNDSTEAPMDEDWILRFRNHAQDVCNGEMQDVWARILSQEARAPGKFSVRALNTLSNVSRNEAEIFQRICLISTSSGHILKADNSFDTLKEYGFNYSDLLGLKHAGLLHDSDTLNVTYSLEEGNAISLLYPQHVLTISRSDPGKIFRFNDFLLTPVGVELMALIPRDKAEPYVERYLLELGSSLEKLGFTSILSKMHRSSL